MRLIKKSITGSDIKRYIGERSDFAFELEVLDRLNALGLDCSHAGTYEDPITKKARQYDIRATKILEEQNNKKLFIRLAVECKKLHDYYPLLIHRIPRTSKETFLQIVWRDSGCSPLHGNPHGYRLDVGSSIYPLNAHVGKSFDQVGYVSDGGSQSSPDRFAANDFEVFDKYSQSLSSSFSLLEYSYQQGGLVWGRGIEVVSVVVPIIVVPDGTLWAMDYGSCSPLKSEPSQVDHVSFFVAKDWRVADSAWFCISHIEFICISALDTLISKLSSPCNVSIGMIEQAWVDSVRPHARS